MKGNKLPVKVAYCFICIFLILLIFLKLSRSKECNPKITTFPDNTYTDTIIVVADSDYQPYSFYCEKGQPEGYDIELIYHLANTLHKNVEIRLMKWTDAIESIISGDADILLGLDYNVSSLNEFELSLPLHNDPFVAFGKKNITSIDDLYNSRIATLEGSGSYSAFLTPFQLEENTNNYSSYSEAFQSVESGENDYAIAMYSVGRRAIANMENTSLKAVGPTLAGNYLCIGVKKGNTELIEEINKAIIQLKKSSVIDKLGDKWLGRYVEVISIEDYIRENLITLIIIITFFIILISVINVIINRKHAKNTEMNYETTKKVLEYQKLITEATKGFYENIYELDITHNCAWGESTMQYFESLNIPPHAPLDEAIRIIATKQIKEEFAEGYLNIFLPENVMKSYEAGIDYLSYDFMISDNYGNYYWMRIMGRIFHLDEDDSVRLITYRQNIDAEKRKEQDMEEKIKVDLLTGLYNKVATEEFIRLELKKSPEFEYTFVMIDIDNFKNVNDIFGHAIGDYVLTEFAKEFKLQSEDGDIVGRVGGDEFVIFAKVESREWLEKKATKVIQKLYKEISVDDKSCFASASMGIALYPHDGTEFEQLYKKADKALYYTKKRGKNGFTFYDSIVSDENQDS